MPSTSLVPPGRPSSPMFEPLAGSAGSLTSRPRATPRSPGGAGARAAQLWSGAAFRQGGSSCPDGRILRGAAGAGSRRIAFLLGGLRAPEPGPRVAPPYLLAPAAAPGLKAVIAEPSDSAGDQVPTSDCRGRHAPDRSLAAPAGRAQPIGCSSLSPDPGGAPRSA